MDARARRGPPGRARLDLALLSDQPILVVNAGSTGAKLALVREDGHAETLHALGDTTGRLAAVAHRIVHGGDRFREPVLLDEAVERSLAEVAALAPLHTRAALDAIADARARFPGTAQVAVFDTAFHATLPAEAFTYALPRRYRDLGVRRYGFHGLSVQWAAGQVPVPRLVVCHLGGGCSVTAVLDGRSVDTTMGLTPLEGVPMVTRAGSVDPGALLYLLQGGHATVDELANALEHESGLLGLTGTDDVASLERSDDPQARLALALFSHRVAAAVAAMTTSLGGLDAVVFTGGIGENSALVRSLVCARLTALGVRLDERANAGTTPDAELGLPEASVRVVALRSREELVIAREARQVLPRPPAG